jgi:hypothetical protein
MSEVMNAPAEIAPVPAPVTDDDLGAVFDRINVNNGSDRADNGKFVSPDPEKREEAEPGATEQTTESASAAEGEAVAGDPPPASDVPLPSNWSGMDEVWAKIPADVRGPIAAHAQKLHATLSEQGRKLSGYGSIQAVFDEYPEYFDGRSKDSAGNPITPAFGIRYLMSVQKAMDVNPAATLLNIADQYGARDALVAILSGKASPAQYQRQQAPQQAVPSTADIEALVRRAVSSMTAEEQIAKAVTDFAADSTRPHYAAVEAEIPDFIPLAIKRLGDTATNNAVLSLAYDMAVHSRPELRSAVTAAKPAAVDAGDPVRTEKAQRAASVNVTSTSSGKTRTLTEEEELGDAYDKAKARA